ncbi:hypothetical protein D9756_011209 [Leucocoprinus leucothites]|uniref:Nephrocystin 3-like N-terminal domain-containing protein n=1 Tax=Leucocoprinus leucothites TaxID=201217 RepID=A0A8H5FRB9_9AGAR|nr:hypothetical protein D9756_011209 [Leucoagaricus leucothites]
MSLEEVETAHSSEVTEGSYTADTSVDLEGSEASSGKPSDLRRGFLLDFPVAEETHNSILRYTYSPCHYLERLRQWGAKNTINAKRISWVCGPAGIGKSALAHSFADSLGPKLGAFFRFSQIGHTNNPSHFFPSISYQLSLRIKLYATSVDEIVRQNPLIYEKSLSQQFYELFVRPLRDVKDKGWFLDEPIVIIDGLEECADERAQENIVKIIAQSVRERSTPFRWLFLGRPEPQLLNTFDIPNILSYTFQLELSISRQFDHEIGSFLVDELRKIGHKHGLPQSWPSEQDVRALLDLSAGLPIYASAAIQFIDKSTMHAPDENLRTILRLPRYLSQSIRGHHLRGLYQLYTLVVERIPLDLLPSAQRILLAGCLRMITLSGQRLLSFLSLSESQFQSACAALSPVIQVADDCSITFFHSSLLDFVSDTAFSGTFAC